MCQAWPTPRCRPASCPASHHPPRPCYARQPPMAAPRPAQSCSRRCGRCSCSGGGSCGRGSCSAGGCSGGSCSEGGCSRGSPDGDIICAGHQEGAVPREGTVPWEWKGTWGWHGVLNSRTGDCSKQSVFASWGACLLKRGCPKRFKNNQCFINLYHHFAQQICRRNPPTSGWTLGAGCIVHSLLEAQRAQLPPATVSGVSAPLRPSSSAASPVSNDLELSRREGNTWTSTLPLKMDGCGDVESPTYHCG